MTPLKIKFWRIESAICMKVLEQDGSTKNTGVLFTSSDGIGLFSHDHPALIGDAIYLRGISKERDNKIASITYEDTDEAKEYLARYIKAVKEYNKSIALEESKAEESDIETVIAE